MVKFSKLPITYSIFFKLILTILKYNYYYKMSSYWSPDNVVQIGESKVEIPAENGLSYSGGGKVSLMIPPSVKFMDGKKSFLQFNLKLALPSGKNPTLLQLDHAGGGMLIKNMRIYDGTRGNLIEELNEYSSLVAMKYDYDTDDSARSIRALEEGGTAHSLKNQGTLGNIQSEYTDTYTNPYFKVGAGKTATLEDADFTTVKCCVPLHAGVFSGKIFPVMMSNGLYLELDLEPASRVIKQLDTAVSGRKLQLNPTFQSLNGSIDAPSDWADGGTTDVFYITTDNNLVGADRVNACPFVVGEAINFIKESDLSEAGLDVPWIISEINACATNGLIEIKSADTVTNSTGEDIVTDEWRVESTSASAETSYDATYTMSDVNLVVHQVDLDPKFQAGMEAKIREGQSIVFDIHSVTNYKNSLLASDRQTSFLVHARNSRAKSIIVSPTDSTIYTSAQLVSASGTYSIAENDADITCNSNRSGYTGICDFLTSVQYQINGKLVPSRPVSTKKCATRNSIDAFKIFEDEKALANAGITPRSFVKFLDNWILGRGFAVGNGIADLRDKDLSVILKYEETSAPTKPKMINSFVFHIRKLTMKGSGAVEVEM
tara:strand:- start:4270 stop:6078 length:1809 start_codon:yes stop_codon:yes gene_type:complete